MPAKPCRRWDQFHYFTAILQSIKLVQVFLCLTNMRILSDHVQHSYPPEAQYSGLTIAHAQQLWDEWENQCMVLVSFSLQVFLLFFTGFRKRYRSRTLSVLLWLAYLSADTVAVYVLGRLTRVAGDNLLVLFWAPFMLLHLGGQEAITAFSLEDCTLWKRHLLNLSTQAALAIYVVGKQWRGDKQLVAPMVLIFISGTAKYMGRIWRLGNAGSWVPGSTPWGPFPCTISAQGVQHNNFYEQLRSLLFYEKKIEFDDMEMEIDQFGHTMNFFFNNIPKSYGHRQYFWLGDSAVGALDGRGELVYKVAEIQLSLIYDFLYTKFGGLMGGFHRFAILVITSVALALFVVHPKGMGASDTVKYYSVADVTISYILLVGAVGLEISSIFMWLITSYWPPYMRRIQAGCRPRIVLSIIKHLSPGLESKGLEWSGKLQQYNLMDEIMQKKVRGQYGWLKWIMWHMDIKQDDDTTTKHVDLSPEVKKVFLHKLCDIASGRDNKKKLAFARFCAEELAAHHKLRPSSSSSEQGATQHAVSNICQGMDLVSSALLWHVVTDICLVHDETPSKFRTCSQHLSNYIMHLIYQCKLMVDIDGVVVIREFRRSMEEVYKIRHPSKRSFVQMARRPGDDVGISREPSLVARVSSVSNELLKTELAASDRWEMIAAVWVQMLCYIARNCDYGFHAKQLCAGGEFLTHAKMVVFLLLKLL